MRLAKNQSIYARRRAGDRRGATMLEVLFALSIAAFLGLSALTLYNQAVGSSRSNRLLQQVTMVVDATHQIFASISSYGDRQFDMPLTTIVAGSGRLPKQMLRGPESITHVYGGDVIVWGQPPGTPWFGQTPQETWFEVNVGWIPVQACHNLLASLNGNGLYGGASVNWSPAQLPPLTGSEIGNLCGEPPCPWCSGTKYVTLRFR